MKWPISLRHSARSAVWYLSLVVLLPLAGLSLLGLIHLWQQDWLLLALLIWLAMTLCGYMLFLLHRPHPSEKTGPPASTLEAPLPHHLHEQADWSEHDRNLWRSLCAEIDQRLQDELPWQRLPDEVVALLGRVAAGYHPQKEDAISRFSRRREFHFTLPEALLVLSVASARYRTVVLQHIPFAERITVDLLVTLYDSKHSIRTGYTWFNTLRRTLRLANPVAAVIGELRDQFTNRLFNQVSESVQRDMKRLLLQEVLQVGIDLYSGRLKASTEELEQYRSRAFQEDLHQVPMAKEPLRVVIIGQTSAGKSSLINALVNSLQVEIDSLPSTKQQVTHRLFVDEDAQPLHLIDTIGLDQDSCSAAALEPLIKDADLLLLVMRANQPARAPDRQLWRALQQQQAADPRRLPPALLVVMTHVDQLSPRAHWQPPYDLADENPKSQNMRAAMSSALEQVALPVDTPIVPVCLATDKTHYNVDAVAAQLMLLQDNATLTQWNRRRIERGEQTFGWRDRWLQFSRLGRVMGHAVTRRRNRPGHEDATAPSSDAPIESAQSSSDGAGGKDDCESLR